MSKSVFVVMGQHFEYTDEYYYAEGGGDPCKAFLDRDSAEDAVEELSRTFFSQCSVDELASFFDGANGGEYDTSSKKAEGSLEERIAYADEIGLRMYYVVEVVMGESLELEEPRDFEFEEGGVLAGQSLEDGGRATSGLFQSKK